MIPLSERCALDGAWPAGNGQIVLAVSAASDGVAAERRLELEAVYGVDSSFRAAAHFSNLILDNEPTLRLPPSMAHLSAGDIVSVNPTSNRLRVLFRKASNNNSFLVTERCDNYCVMCSQPPRRVDDGYLVDEIAAAIPRLPKNLHEIGFTGGEPTLLGDRFIGLLHLCKEELPRSAVHVLTNGRSFSRPEFARKWASVAHPDLMAGIPIYSDQSTIHDFVVQADGAFDETIRGVLNLKKLRQRVEIRMVMHRHTIGRLDRFAEFVTRNLPFVDHVALMGLELMGFAKANADDLWIDPREHADVIADAAHILDCAGLRTSIYNLPLCVLAKRAHRFAIQSISDWKREYWDACEGCSLKETCGGAFFSSRARLEPYIRPVATAN